MRSSEGPAARGLSVERELAIEAGDKPDPGGGRTVSSCRRHASISTLAPVRLQKISPLNSSSRSDPSKPALQPFSQGEPGAMESVFTPTLPSHSCKAGAMNPEPLCDRIPHQLQLGSKLPSFRILPLKAEGNYLRLN